MHTLTQIRRCLQLTQAELAEALDMTQGNIGHYEQCRQQIPPDVARRIIKVAYDRGMVITYDDIYNVEAAA